MWLYGAELRRNRGHAAQQSETPDASKGFSRRARVLDHKTRTSISLPCLSAGEEATTARPRLAGRRQRWPGASFTPLQTIRPGSGAVRPGHDDPDIGMNVELGTTGPAYLKRIDEVLRRDQHR